MPSLGYPWWCERLALLALTMVTRVGYQGTTVLEAAQGEGIDGKGKKRSERREERACRMQTRK